MKRRFAWAIVVLLAAGPAFAFDHAHKAWDDLLHRHVKVLPGGNASRVDYAGIARQTGALKAVLADYAKVTRLEFDAWTPAQQQAFLIDDYNALTIEKILTRYPDIRSIRDFGLVFGNPWKDRFFTLLGESASLDVIEDMLRKPGAYDEPRLHFALVCASIGCPMLRNEAITADKLEAQLNDGMARFLSDRTRNRYDPKSRKLEVSKIFDWYGKDFEQGHKGFTSVKATLAKFADSLADAPGDRAVVRAQQADVSFLDYDWSLNDANR